MDLSKFWMFLAALWLISTGNVAEAACYNYEDEFPNQCATLQQEQGNWSHPSRCINYVECLCCAEYERRFPEQERAHWRQKEWIEACEAAHFCVECGGNGWRNQCSVDHWEGPYDTRAAIDAFEFSPVPEYGRYTWCAYQIWDDCKKEHDTYAERKACSQEQSRICATCPVEANREYERQLGGAQFCPGYGFGYFPPTDNDTYINVGPIPYGTQTSGGSLLGGPPLPEEYPLPVQEAAVPVVAGYVVAGFRECIRYAPCRNAIRDTLKWAIVSTRVVAVAIKDAIEPEVIPPYFHYTDEEGRKGIVETSDINIGGNGYVYLTRDIYPNGIEAQARLALSRIPIGYFKIPAENIDVISDEGVVEPYNGQPGGGYEYLVPHPVSIEGAVWIPLSTVHNVGPPYNDQQGVCFSQTTAGSCAEAE